MLTSTCLAFTKPFKTKLESIQHVADETGSRPEYPPVSTILTAALNSYNRLRNSGEYITNKKNPAAHNASVTSEGVQAKDAEVICWNCGKKGHRLPDCPQPRNEEKISKSRTEFFNRKRAQNKPKRKLGPGGKPMVLNKNGYYVLDQKRWKEQQPPKTSPTTSTEASGAAAASSPTSDPEQPKAHAAHAAGTLPRSAPSNSRADAIREAFTRAVAFGA